MSILVIAGKPAAKPKLTNSFPPDIRQAGVPPAIVELGDDAIRRFIEFFTSNIRNKNTRTSYARAVVLSCCRAVVLSCCLEIVSLVTSALHDITPVNVSAWIEELSTQHTGPTVKQHLAAIRMLFDFLIIGQIMPTNPAHAVRGPKHVVKKGKTPILSAHEVKELFASIDTGTDARK